MTLCKSMDIAVSSRRTYAGHQKQFLDFCEAFGWEPLAVSEEELCMVAAHFTLGHTSKSVRSYMSALQKLYTDAGAGPLPRGPKFLLFLKGLTRLFGPADEVVRTRALDVSELRSILASLDQGDPNQVCMGVQLLLAFLLALRTEDHTDGRLRWGDVFTQRDGSVEFLLPPGKSVRRFRRVAIAARQDDLHFLPWLKLHASNLAHRGAAFNEPVFVSFTDGGGVKTKSRAQFVKELKALVANVLGCSPALYAGYSLRRGGVTEMLTQGVPLAIIKAHVGWTPESNAHCTYYDHSGRIQMRVPTSAMGGAGGRA